jgi:hypothetical protein
MTEREYHEFVAEQRALGRAHVDRLLDEFVRELGWYPHATWRAWRQDWLDHAALALQAHYAAGIVNPRDYLLTLGSMA